MYNCMLMYYVCRFYRAEDLCLISARQVQEKCFMIDVAKDLGYVFVSRFPNVSEVE